MSSRFSKSVLLAFVVGTVIVVALDPGTVTAQRGGGQAPAASAGPCGALRWRGLGPNRGGRSIAVAGSVARPHEYYMGATGGGLWKTTDGGVTWRPVTDGHIHSSSVGAVAIAPSNADIVYLGTGESEIRGNIIQGDGAYKSIDGGDHWAEISRHAGLPRGMLGKIGLSVSGADSARVYAQIEAEDGGFFLSDDAGATWSKVTDRRDLRQRAFYYTRVYADPKVKDTVYVLNVAFHKSTDAGRTWTLVRPPHGDNHDLWIAASESGRMIEANDGGATVSVNGGETWTPETMPTSQVYHVVTTTHVADHVCGAQQDHSTACVSSQP